MNIMRRPAVAGTFYPDNPELLSEDLTQRIRILENKKSVIALISPHAGYFYSGICAGKGFGAINIPDRVIVLGVNHSGIGASLAIDGHDSWDMPMGQVEIDSQLRDQLASKSDLFIIEENSGINEHSIEVQIPFLQYLNPNVKILPILLSRVNYNELEAGAIELSHLIKHNSNKDILIVASTDMSHYVSASFGEIKDQMAIEKIRGLNPKGLLDVVVKEKISMCGVYPVVMSLIAANELGANETQVIEYTNSGEASGDYDQVVGYLSMTIA